LFKFSFLPKGDIPNPLIVSPAPYFLGLKTFTSYLKSTAEAELNPNVIVSE